MVANSLRTAIVVVLLVGCCWVNLQRVGGKIMIPRYLRSNTGSPIPDAQRRLLSTTEHNNTEFFSKFGEVVHHDNSTGSEDHTTGHLSGHPALFQALSAIHVESGTYAIFIIIAFIVVLKQLIHAVHALTHDTPFYEMISKIEEELMLVGASAFIFKVILNTTDFGSVEWAYPLEFAETLVPILAFSYCGLGLYVVLISLKQCYTWSRAHNLKVLEILDQYFEATKQPYFKYVLANVCLPALLF
jgi:hypothetical protein